MKIIDITYPLNADVPVWPGDLAFEHVWTGRIGPGSIANVSALRLSAHTGTHVDAPYHVDNEGATLDRFPLDRLIGPALVVDATQATLLTVDLVQELDLTAFPRVLFRTRRSLNAGRGWTDDFPAFDPALIDHLAASGVVLIGTDAPSIDPADSVALPAHHAFVRGELLNVENLLLRDVQPGAYYLIALPLSLPGADGAPLRAVLLEHAPAQVQR